MTTSTSPLASEVQECTPEEGREMLEAAAQRHLGMTAVEFLTSWDSGEFADNPDRPEVIKVAMLIPFGRQ